MTNQEAEFNDLANILMRMIKNSNPTLDRQMLKNTIKMGNTAVSFAAEKNTPTRSKITGFR